MGDDITIGVTEIVNNIEVTAQPNDQVVDINVVDNTDEVTLNITPTVIEINVNKGSSYARWGTIYGNLTDQTDLTNALILKADLVDGKVPAYQLPSFVDDVVEVANYAALPAMGEIGKIYVTLDNNKIYRWSGSIYIEIAANNAIWGAITGTLSNQTDLQNALNLKANDNAVVHLTGDESITGTKTFNNSTISSSIRINNSNIGSGLIVENSSAGYGILSNNTSTSFGIYSYNQSAGRGIYSENITTGTGIYSLNSSTGIGFESLNYSTGIGAKFINNSTGKNLVIASTSSGTGMAFTIQKNDVDKFTINDAGEATGVKFIKSGGTSSQFLKADGSVDSTTYATDSNVVHLTGVETITGQKTFNNSSNIISIYSNNTSVGTGIYSDNSGIGTGIQSINSSSGLGFYSQNTSTGKGIQSNNTSTGRGIYSQNSSTGQGFYSDNSGTGTALYLNNQSSGKNLVLMNTTAATGMPFTIQKQGLDVFTINDAGEATANSFINVNSSSSGSGFNSSNTSTGVGINSYNTGTGRGIYSSNSSTGVGIDSENTSTAIGIRSINSSSGIGFYSTNSSNGVGIGLNNSSTGKGIVLDNTSTGTGIYLTNSSTGTGIRTINSSSSSGIYATNSSIGEAIRCDNSSTGIAIYSNNSSSGRNLVLNNTATATGIPFTVKKDGTDKFTVNDAGGVYAAGSVGIGTASPTQALDVNGNIRLSASDSRLYGGDNVGRFIIGNPTVNTYLAIYGSSHATLPNFAQFVVNNSAVLNITSTGSVGMGTTSPTKKLHIKGGNDDVLFLDNGGERYTTQYFANNGTTKSFLVWDNTSSIFEIGTAASSDLRLLTNNAERMRITSGGDVLVGRSSLPAAFGDSKGLTMRQSGAVLAVADDDISGLFSRRNSDGSVVLFRRDSTTVGSIGVTTTLTSYNVTSDYRLKQDFKPFNGLDLVSKIKVYDYAWKADNSRMNGVIAHELQEVVPYAVTGEKDGDAMQQVDYSKLVPILVQAIQELQEKINKLENK